MSLSYHPLRLVDISIRAVVVHQGLPLPVLLVLLRHSSELMGRPVAKEPVPSL
jgi:hypothetical protein